MRPTHRPEGGHGGLYIDGVDLDAVAQRFGTPTYVYARATLARSVAALRAGFANLSPLICYAVKANGNLAVLQAMRALGCGFDAVSAGELQRVYAACGRFGAPAPAAAGGGEGARSQSRVRTGTRGNGPPVLLSGVGKTDDEIAMGLRQGVFYISCESAEELHAVARIAAQMNVVAPVSLRVNPDVDARTHPYIATGLKENKFGVPIEAAASLIESVATCSQVKVVGVSCHIGSQILSTSPFIDAATRLSALAQQLVRAGVPLSYIGMGGGLGIAYHDEVPPSAAAYGAALAPILAPLQLRLVLEPGRMLVGHAGVLLTRVVRGKAQGGRRFVVVDAGMNDLLRPALYEAHHAIEPVAAEASSRTPQVVQDVVGPVCESADTLAGARTLPPLHTGDLLAVHGVGAYGFCMASNYNARPRPAEVWVDGTQVALVRSREVYCDLWRGEHGLPPGPDGNTHVAMSTRIDAHAHAAASASAEPPASSRRSMAAPALPPGIITALVTPMLPGGEIDWPALDLLVDRQIDAGVAGLCACGTTAEAATLTDAERDAVLRRVVARARGHVCIVAGVGQSSTAATLDAMRRAQACGADFALVVTPPYNRPSQRGLAMHYGALAQNCTLPIILYNVPARTGCDMWPATVGEVATHPAFVGLKDATGELPRLARLQALVPHHFALISGDDPSACAFLLMGGTGIISVAANALPQAMVAMDAAARGGDARGAAAAHRALCPFFDALNQATNPTAIKAALAIQGHMHAAVRLPLCEVPQHLWGPLRAGLQGEQSAI